MHLRMHRRPRKISLMPTRDTSRSPLANAQPSLRSSSLGAVFMGLAALSTTGCGDASGVGTSGEAATPRTARQALTGRPASCQELKTAQPAAADGQYVLYVNGDATKPWTAYCHDMAGTPKEYLSLPSTGPSLNFSQYTAGYNNGWGATNVRTLFSKVRVDPATLRVTTGDQTFSSSSGLLWHGDAVTSMSYAAAMNCDFGSPGLGNVDLRGTSFAVAPNQFVAVGHYASGGANYSANDQVVDLWNYGECGWMSVQGADHPLNGRSAQLQLQYRQQQPTQTRIDSLSWQAAGPGTRSATPGGQLADTMSFDYSLGGTDVWSFQTWNFTTTAQESKVLNFDWNYVGFHAWYMVWASATAFADGPNGRTTVPLYTQNYGGNWDVSGSASLQLHQGYPFGVIVEGQNFDSHSYLQGSVKLTQKP